MSSASTTRIQRSAAGVHIFGIRHHGPGSARSLRQTLEQLRPDIILVEGPPDGAPVLPLLAHAKMQPPVALLLYATNEPQRAIFYPFAVFSPEWQALHYGLTHDITVRFMDLPQTHQMALRIVEEQSDEENEADQPPDEQYEDTPEPSDGGVAIIEDDVEESDDLEAETHALEIRADPLRWLAEAAGYSDGERWWEHMVEHRQNSADLFDAILEAMTVLRSETPAYDDPFEARREAHMRQSIRTAQGEGYQCIAVVCGAWHAPVLNSMPPVKEDIKLLKNLPKVKVQATWVPWTYGRLCYGSGYGAGIESPGWYDHLWTMYSGVVPQPSAASVEPLPTSTRITIHWMTRVARLLRGQDLDASSAHAIEAVRLAESLAALRNRPLPGLPELNEATQAVFCAGSDMPMHLIYEQLIMSDRLGEVPDETPLVPLQQDLRRLQKRLRLKPEPEGRKLELDLRNVKNDLDRDRSRLLHRLNLLHIPWGRRERVQGDKHGTYHEQWLLQWQPEFDVALIEAGIWGNTITDAAAACARDTADHAPDLPTLISLLKQVLDAELPTAIDYLTQRVQTESAVASEVIVLMGALPELVRLQRYGSVRQIDPTIINPVIDGIATRVCIGLPGGCASLNDDAAAQMFDLIVSNNSAIDLLQNEEHLANWHTVLTRLVNQQDMHGLVAGRCCRILFDTTNFAPQEAERQMRLALSNATEPPQAAAWIEGFLKESGTVLIHDMRLWQVLDTWVESLSLDNFNEVVPLLRRTFATFSAPERRQMGERVRQQSVSSTSDRILVADGEAVPLDIRRAEAVLPILATVLGVRREEP